MSLAFRSTESVRADFLAPELAGIAVPAWRDAALVADPRGIAAGLQAQARAWSWTVIGNERIDRWVAEALTGYAEEVLKVAGALRDGRTTLLAVERSVLAIRLAPILGVHLRLLARTEDDLWDAVAERLGQNWQGSQQAALGIGGEDLRASARASLRMFDLAAAEIRPLLDERQRRVVEGALGHVT